MSGTFRISHPYTSSSRSLVPSAHSNQGCIQSLILGVGVGGGGGGWGGGGACSKLPRPSGGCSIYKMYIFLWHPGGGVQTPPRMWPCKLPHLHILRPGALIRNKVDHTAVLQLLCDFAYMCQRVNTGDSYIFYFGYLYAVGVKGSGYWVKCESNGIFLTHLCPVHHRRLCALSASVSEL